MIRHMSFKFIEMFLYIYMILCVLCVLLLVFYLEELVVVCVCV